MGITSVIRMIALVVAVLAAATSPAITQKRAHPLAPTPPMGWNSWDAYGFTIDEAQFKANARVLEDLKPYGWTYAVIDEGWYMQNPFGDRLETRKYLLDGHGLLTPVPARFPSAAGGAGFKPLADWLHARGLKFGIHIVRGIPKQAVADNLPIAGSVFRAADAADTKDACPWDDANWGVSDTPAGQAYYDQMMRLYAGWGLDFIKVDCIADHPYKASEIRQIAAAIKKAGRPMVLSLSPGPAQLSHAAELTQYSQMWRIANDTWDGWRFVHQPPDDDFPNGLVNAFDSLAKWSGSAGPGHWPDADMLPFGSLEPHPGWGDPRASRLTPDEERAQLTLWAIARSPLILGANLTRLDDVTRTLITNRRILQVDQTARGSHPLENLPPGFEHARVWVASAGAGRKAAKYVALFNLDNHPASLQATWAQLGAGPGARRALDLWSGRRMAASKAVDLTLPAHGGAIFRVE